MNTKFKSSYIPVPKSNLPSIKILKNKVKKSLLNYFLCLQFVHSFEKGNFMTISHTIENMVMLSKLENLLKSKGICKIICNKNKMYLQFYKLHSSIHCKINVLQ